MSAFRLAVLNDSEDAVGELHNRFRRARNKYIGRYRMGVSVRVAEQGGRGRRSRRTNPRPYASTLAMGDRRQAKRDNR